MPDDKWWEEQKRKSEEEWDKPQKMKCPVCGNWVIVQPEDFLIPVEDLCEECFKYDEECQQLDDYWDDF